MAGRGVGVVVPSPPAFGDRAPARRGRAARARRSAGYDLLLFDVEAPEQRAGAMRDLVRRDRVAGPLISRCRSSTPRSRRFSAPLPTVLFDVAHPRLPRVVIDTSAAVSSLPSTAREGPSPDRLRGGSFTNPYGFTSSEDRRGGSSAALGREGRSTRLERSGRTGGTLPSRRPGICRAPRAADRDLRGLRPACVGVLKAAEGRGLRCPGPRRDRLRRRRSAEIVGLTTIRQPLREGGALAADLFLAAIERRPRPPRRGLPGLTVVERRTT